jgi:hypothetical protein
MTTTPDFEGVEPEGSLSRDEAANALLSRWTDADQPSRDEEGAKPIRRSETERTPDEDNPSEDDDLDLGDDEEQDDTDDKADVPVEATDDAVVKLTVDGEEISVAVKDLKRLYGQEASLTRKSQEVAEKRQFAEAEGARFVVATQHMLERANKRFEPYANIDWGIAAKTLENDEYVALRQEATAAYQDVRFLNEELENVFKQTEEARQATAAKEAEAAIEVLSKDIPGFDAEVYTSMVSYAVAQGIPEEAAHQLTDPTALKLIHKAMAYDRAKERAATKRKAAPTSKRTMTSTSRNPQGRVGSKANDALQKLAKTGSRDDAVAALMERWSSNSDD